MQVSIEWLNEFVDISDIEPELIAHKLTMSGLEVEEIEITKPKFTNIITAKITALAPHPDADKLQLATVDTGNATKTVVCGAKNIAVGQIIPYASVGSVVFSRKTGEQFTLTPAVIRGVESQGMLCSSDELGLDGLQEEDGILILNRLYKDVILGQKLEDLLGLNGDTILHLAPTANRGDQMSIIGVAREISALFDKKMNFSPLTYEGIFKKNDFEVEIKDTEVAKYYSIGVIKDITIKPSPDFIQRRITACGMRPINNIVDITNYVLMEYGTPLHAFDFDTLNNYLCVRYAKPGETITTIDEVERKLTEESVLIATREQGVCIAGVFGGSNSEVGDSTKNIALEAAHFTAHTNRKSARSVGYRSEASARFERGVDLEMVKPALLRALDLITKYADGKLESIVETGSNELNPAEITLRNSEILRILGIEIPQETCVNIAQNLGFELLGKNELAAKFKVPSFRAGDVVREIDLIEEISRIFGYEKIAPTLPKITEGAEISIEERNIKKVNELFLGYGFSEIMTSSLVGKGLYAEFLCELDDTTSVRVKNPQSEEHTTLRQSLIPNLLNVVKYNFDNGNKNLWLYEIGKVYNSRNPVTKEDTGVEEKRILSGAVFGSINSEIWNNKTKPDFYTIKGTIEALFEELKLSNRIIYSAPNEAPNYLHPAQCAKIELLGKNPTTLGYVGKIHPILKDNLKLNQDLYIFELDLELILASTNPTLAKFKKLPQTGIVQRDIALGVDVETTCEQIIKAIKKAADKNIFKDVAVFDIYQGENIEKGKKSVAIRLFLQDESTTLTDAQIENEVNKIKTALQNSISNLTLR